MMPDTNFSISYDVEKFDVFPVESVDGWGFPFVVTSSQVHGTKKIV